MRYVGNGNHGVVGNEVIAYSRKIDLKGTDKLRHFEYTIVIDSVDELIANMKKRLSALLSVTH